MPIVSGRDRNEQTAMNNMGEIINLNRYRKNRERREVEAQAAENRIRFGLSKDERLQDKIERDRRQSDLDNKKLE